MRKLLYFAYGSNMSIKRLRARVPSALALCVGELPDHTLAFHKNSTRDGSSKCDITVSRSDKVLGVLFEISVDEKPELDRQEGLGYGYNEKLVEIVTEDRGVVKALTYFAININAELLPYSWYKRHVLEGAKEAELPSWYTTRIENVPCNTDPDKVREARELKIYS